MRPFQILTLWALLTPPALAGVRVVNGERVAPEEVPWAVQINKTGEQWCTGSIIASRWILTAAHCFADADPTLYQIRAGGDGRAPTLQLLPQVVRIELAPNYSVLGVHGDAALMELESDIPFGATIQAIPLAGKAELAELAPDTLVRLAGWGAIGVRWESMPPMYEIPPLPEIDLGRSIDWSRPFVFTPPPAPRPIEMPPVPTFPAADRLTMLELPLAIPERIADMDFFREGHNADYLDGNFLFMRQFGYTSCAGDSGGGWTAQIAGERKLVAIHKAGDYCVSLAVGTRVDGFLDWIRGLIGE